MTDERFLNFRGVGYTESLSDWRKSYFGETMPKLEIVFLHLKETGRTARVGRFGRTTTLKTYNALDAAGTVVGTISLDMATFERRTPGRTWVNSRWQSPRWFYTVVGNWKRSIPYDTRRQAIDAMLGAINHAAQEAALSR